MSDRSSDRIRISTFVSPETNARIKANADQLGQPMTTWVGRAVEAWLAEMEAWLAKDRPPAPVARENRRGNV